MNHVDVKYVGMLSGRLERFKVKAHNPYKVNFRCPICGDSKKSKSKARGWILETKDNNAVFYCHNCHASLPLAKFLEQVDPIIHNEYIVERKLESYKSSGREKKEKKDETPLEQLFKPKPSFQKKSSPLSNIKKVSQLKADHPAREYINKRMIPPDQHHRLYYAPKFRKWAATVVPGEVDDIREEPRLVIPLIDPTGAMIGFQGRAFDPKSLRYITFMIDKDMPKVFGMDKVDLNEPYLVVEGPLDSLFLENSIAFAGSSGDLQFLQDSKDNRTLVFDNEPRNKEIVAEMEKCIERGERVCIWPTSPDQKQDINDMVKAGTRPMEIDMIIKSNSFKGLTARLELNRWRRI